MRTIILIILSILTPVAINCKQQRVTWDYQTGEYTFRYDPDYFGKDPKRLWTGITLCIDADGDTTYKSAVQELNIHLK